MGAMNMAVALVTSFLAERKQVAKVSIAREINDPMYDANL